ncbi:retinol dehydrogenase 12 [Aaosphaeria arxii CBS 175.79]|uniref:Retinol dehydrogenase 12 n=1 Tax=Aaosphaeria arxii CBS 175.79 TaxID=1450172 RepID=A0A6A5X935_9PLEO|nr:retinol dehydrogenase 12 [Aaosphaeria arxii CBS 175.79]KAF2009287.1 retinol dehydrogenase 12 [Aaosphaeria arxii CBS 175.79]
MSWAVYIPKLLSSQLFFRIPQTKHNFSDQTIVVTGANTGLGIEAARLLVDQGAAKVILAVRSIAKGEAAAVNILKTTKATKNAVEVWQLDLSNHDSIKAFAKRVSGLERLDAVIQNAGIMSLQRAEIEGVEQHIQVNVIGAVLVGLLVLPKLRETGKKFGVRTRLSFVGSDLMYVARASETKTEGSLLKALGDEEKANINDRYPTSKLLLFYAVQEIAKRSALSASSNVVINVMTPGACNSDLMRDDINIVVRVIQSGMKSLIARSTVDGGRLLIDAIKPDLAEETHGRFLMDCRIGENGPNVESDQGRILAKRFNGELFTRLDMIAPGVTKIL